MGGDRCSFSFSIFKAVAIVFRETSKKLPFYHALELLPYQKFGVAKLLEDSRISKEKYESLRFANLDL